MLTFMTKDITKCYKYKLFEGLYLVFDFSRYVVESIRPMCIERKNPNNPDWSMLRQMISLSDEEDVDYLDILVGSRRVGNNLECSCLCQRYYKDLDMTELLLRVLMVSPSGKLKVKDISLASYGGEYNNFECPNYYESSSTRKNSLNITDTLGARFTLSRLGGLGKLSVEAMLYPDYKVSYRACLKSAG